MPWRNWYNSKSMHVILGLVVDSAVMALAYAAAFALRFDFQPPQWGWLRVCYSFVTVWAVQLAMLIACDCLRRWHLRSRDLLRFMLAFGCSVAVLVAFRLVFRDPSYLSIRPPFTINLINGLMWAAGVFAVRWIWTLFVNARRREAKLLNRKERVLADENVKAHFSGKCVLVTGAGGTIGSEIVRQVLDAGARQVLMVERCENALYEICEEVMESGRAVPLMLDINEPEKIAAVLEKWKPQVVLHAAAYKHLPMCEVNPDEAWRNNTRGTEGLVTVVKRAGIGNFVMISTDKAVNPSSVMGRTKLAAETPVLANGYTVVRFGNVLGSSGSVVPKWERQIANGGPVTITDRRMTRYFMTVQEAVGLVLVAATMQGGSVYTLDMGKPVRLVDLAEEMIRQAGYRPYRDISIVFTGIRPGEKLSEELGLERAKPTDHAKIYRC